MNNYINVRIQTTNNGKTVNDIKHNLRLVKSLSKSNSEDNIYINKDGKIITTNEEKREIISEYYQDRELHNELYKEKNKRQLRESNSTYISGVFTFSEQIKHDLGEKYTQEELIKVGYDCLKEIADKLGSEIKYITLHMDEKTPHFQFHLTNFNTDNTNSIFFQNRTREKLSNLQEIGYKHFKELGMNRGEKKIYKEGEKSNMDYTTVREYNERDINTLLRQKQEELKQLTELRKEVKKLELTTEEKREVRKEYSQQMKEIKKDIKDIKDILKNKTNKIIDTSKNAFGVIDKKLLYSNIYKELEKISKLDIKINENEKLISKVESLEEQNDILYKKYTDISSQDTSQLTKEVKRLNSSLDTKNEFNTTLNNENRELKILTNKQKTDISTLQDKISDLNETIEKIQERKKSRVLENDNDLNVATDIKI